MKKIFTSLILAATALTAADAQGWPANYEGVMLQGFYWDSYSATKWSKLESQAEEISNYFSLLWVPQSAFTGSSTSMGYDPLYYFDQHSSFGTEEQLLRASLPMWWSITARIFPTGWISLPRPTRV